MRRQRLTTVCTPLPPPALPPGQTIRAFLKTLGMTVDSRTAHRVYSEASLLAKGEPDSVAALRPYLAAYKAKHRDAHYCVETTRTRVPAPEPAPAGAGAGAGGAPAMVDEEVLTQAFVAFAPTVRLVRDAGQWLKPYVTVDGAHCRRGTLLTLVASDANGALIQLAVGMVKSESTASWTWFFNQCVTAYPRLREWAGALIVSCDGDKGAGNGIAAVFAEAQRVYCVKHRKRNIYGLGIYNLFEAAACAVTEAGFDAAMAELHLKYPEGYAYVMERDPRMWANCKYNPRAFGKLTSNDAGACAQHRGAPGLRVRRRRRGGG